MKQDPVQPRQARSRESLERILDATERLLERRPFSDVRVTDIAEEAGVSAGLLYSRFESKDVILPYLVTRFMEEQEASFREAFGRDGGAAARVAADEEGGTDPGPQRDATRERVAALVRQVSGMAESSVGLLRAAAARRLLNPDVLTEEERAISGGIRAMGRRWLEGGADRVRRADPARALDFVNWMVFLAAQLAPVLVEDDDALDALMADLTDAMTLYLTAPAGASDAHEEEDA